MGDGQDKYRDAGRAWMAVAPARPPFVTSQAMPAIVPACTMALGGARQALLEDTTSPMYVTRDVSDRGSYRVSCPASRVATQGYTMIELVVVIIIIGVLAAVVGPRFFETRVFNERGYADEIASAMRYSQKIAVGSGCNVRLAITTTGYVAMQQIASGNRCNTSSNSWTTPVIRIDGSALSGTPPADANVSGAATLVFDNKGAVISGATNLTVGTYTLALDAASGFVVVQ